ncbi:unnamed protein product [Hydatigera taeniaeformis]|uniref:Uridylate-specific endoribonuclease n=1 Tax=Hydatigena taeniaeformis TaxID=6205 RepID=A0A0R3X6V3_HYDTA|nr:unnamed protein product [Hydatigera taeniaeformis]
MVIKEWERSPTTAIKNLIMRLPNEHLFYCILNLLTLTLSTGCMSNFKLHQAIANAWFRTSVRGIMEQPHFAVNTAFQHVFIGEKSNTNVLGLHHGGRAFLLYDSGRLHLLDVNRRHHKYNILDFSFEWDGLLKKRSTIFFGLPVEFEMLLYFISCIYSKHGEFRLLLDKEEIKIKNFMGTNCDRFINATKVKTAPHLICLAKNRFRQYHQDER